MLTMRNGFLASCLLLGQGCSKTDFVGSNDKKKPQIVSFELQQESLPVVTLDFMQGYSGQPVSETWNQDQLLLDLQLVIDNSGSMGQEQTNLASKLDPLLSAVADTDWQIHVTTTSVAEGCSRGLIKKSDPDFATKFAAAVTAGINGQPNERGVYQAVEGLKCSPDWVRANSVVAVLIVSDEDNCSDGACPSLDEKTGKLLLDYLNSIRKLGETARVYGLLSGPTASDMVGCDVSSNKIAPLYHSLIQQTGGQWGSICLGDFSPTLRKISEDVATLLKSSMSLSLKPDAGSLTVLLDGQPWDGYELDGQQVTFKSIPAVGAVVQAQYTHGRGGELLDRFSLDGEPRADTLQVKVNSVLVEESSYQLAQGVDGWDLVFVETPLDETAITVSYRKGADLPAAFMVGSCMKRLVTVTVDGENAEATYAPDSGLVTFVEAPAPGARIAVELEK